MPRQTSESNLYRSAAFIEMPSGDYQKFIQGNTTLIRREFTEADMAYENGQPIASEFDSFVEVRKGDSWRGIYVYSEYTEKLWCLESLEDATKIFSAELEYCNKRRKEDNEFNRLNSIKTATQEQSAGTDEDSTTRWLELPIVLKYSYTEFVEIAFDIHTPQRRAARYQKALIGARIKAYADRDITFIVPFFPAKGRIRIKAN